MLLHKWGSSVASLKTIPLWVKFEKVPDCYRTQEGMSNLASVIGPPICADDLTSNLEVLPYAKFCVHYTVGNELTQKIKVLNLDAATNEKTIEVFVSYPNKPLVCTACKTLGHRVGACQKVTRKWVRKERQRTEIPKEKYSKFKHTWSHQS